MRLIESLEAQARAGATGLLAEMPSARTSFLPRARCRFPHMPFLHEVGLASPPAFVACARIPAPDSEETVAVREMHGRPRS